MKRLIFRRGICALLTLLILLSTVSCTDKTEPPKKEEEYDEEIKLEVLPESVTYSDSFIENANERFAKIAVSLAESYIGISLDEKQKQSIGSEFKKTVIPIAYRVRIYEEELDAIFTSFENYLDEGKELSAFDLYEKCLYEIGSTRSGMLAYEISVEIIERKEKSARERYLEYEYEWYLEDAERCAALIQSLTDMGENKFVSIASIMTSLTSLTKGLNYDGESAFVLSSADLLYILSYQGELFESSDLTEDDFSTFGALIQELIPKRPDTLHSAMLYVLKNNEYFPTALRCMPKVISLYADMTDALEKEGRLDANGDADQCARALASAMLSSESALTELDTALKQYAMSATESEKSIIDSFATEDEGLLTEIHAISLSELKEELGLIALDSSVAPYDRLQDAVTSYLYGIAPYITLAFLI